MPSTPTPEALAQRLREILERGVSLSPEVLRFIDSTFSNPSADELAAILEEESNAERDTLLELLFSPDEWVQLELEEFLALHSPEAVDAGQVAELLCRAKLLVAFGRPDGGALRVALTPTLALGFVRQLKTDRPVPPPIAAAIDARATGRDRLHLRVLIRSARFEFTPSNIEFLCRLIAQVGFEDEAGRDCFSFILELLAEIGNEADIGRALTGRRRLLIRALTQARRQREHMAAANFETLASRGQRLTWVDEAVARRQMACIDRICLAVFGRIEQFELARPEDAYECCGTQDLTDLMRRLT